MNLAEWFQERIGKRVHVEIQGIAPQSWRVYMVGEGIVVLVQPSVTKSLDQLTVFLSGITRIVDVAKAKTGSDIVGNQWDPKLKRWIPLTLAEFQWDESKPALDNNGDGPDVPDHLPGDIG